MPKIKQTKDVTFNPAEVAEEEVAEEVAENAEEKVEEAEVNIVNPLKEKMVKIRLRKKHFCNPKLFLFFLAAQVKESLYLK